jgi:gamma-glutamyltranspeptidase/glutathione hydrolase
MRRLAAEGPDYFITGAWAKHFVEEGNRLGWPVKLEHLVAIPPRWQEPLRYAHRGHEILQLGPPERTGVFSALVLGILESLDTASLGPITASAESLYYMASALRWAEFELGISTPRSLRQPADVWPPRAPKISPASCCSRPKVDLTGTSRHGRQPSPGCGGRCPPAWASSA